MATANARERSVPTDVYTYVVDGRGRDPASPSNQYIVTFDDVYKSVTCVELVLATYPTPSGGSAYVNLCIKELDPLLAANMTTAIGTFGQLPTTAAAAPGSVNVYFSGQYRCMRAFNKPLSKLSRMTIAFTKPDGTPAAMTEDHMLRFEITCMQLTGGVMDWRSMDVISQKTTTQFKYSPEAEVELLANLGMSRVASGMPSVASGIPSVASGWEGVVKAFKSKYKAAKRRGASQNELDELKARFKDAASQWSSS